VLYNKPVLVQRGSFRPVTKATLDVMERGLEQFIQEPEIKEEQPVVLMEMTLRHLTTGDKIDAADFLERAETLSALGQTVLVSNFRRFHRLASYLSRYTKRPLGIALGASNLKEIFDEGFYNESEGGLLGGLGQLFKNPARLYVYPHLDLASGQLITAQTYPVAAHLKHLYAHLLENRYIQGIAKYNRDLVRIRRREVLDGIEAGSPEWDSKVPPAIVELIKKGRLFGYGVSRLPKPQSPSAAEPHRN